MVKIGKIEKNWVKIAFFYANFYLLVWAGAVFELLEHLGRGSEAKDGENIKKVKWGPTDERT